MHRALCTISSTVHYVGRIVSDANAVQLSHVSVMIGGLARRNVAHNARGCRGTPPPMTSGASVAHSAALVVEVCSGGDGRRRAAFNPLRAICVLHSLS
jgi:hypothetical protein